MVTIRSEDPSRSAPRMLFIVALTYVLLRKRSGIKSYHQEVASRREARVHVILFELPNDIRKINIKIILR